MKNLLHPLFAGIVALAAISPVPANVIVSLEPGSLTLDAGSTTSLDLVISGLGDHTSPSLGAFDLDLTYNPSLLSPTSVSFGSQLDLGSLGSLQSFSLGGGLIHLDEVSFEASSDLLASQPASFKLATLGFLGLGPGFSPVDFAGGSLSDESGTISLPFTSVGSGFQIIGTVSVPDSASTGLLLGMAFVAVVGAVRWPVFRQPIT